MGSPDQLHADTVNADLSVRGLLSDQRSGGVGDV